MLGISQIHMPLLAKGFLPGTEIMGGAPARQSVGVVPVVPDGAVAPAVPVDPVGSTVVATSRAVLTSAVTIDGAAGWIVVPAAGVVDVGSGVAVIGAGVVTVSVGALVGLTTTGFVLPSDGAVPGQNRVPAVGPVPVV